MQSFHIEIPDEMATSLNEAVASGQYHTRNEAILSALEQWHLQRQVFIRNIRTAWDEGIASGLSSYHSIDEILSDRPSEK